MTSIRAALFQAAFYLWTTFMVLIFVPALLGPKRWTVRGQAIWASGVVAILRVLADIRLEVRGIENLPQGAVIVASKHQSAFDTLIYHRLLRDPAIVMKKELLKIPIYGSYSLKVGMIPVDRKAGAKALRGLLKGAEAAKAQARPILIFPEGTRTAPGRRVPYQAGISALYKALGLPVVPVALNSGLFWPRRAFAKWPGTIVMEFLPVIPPGLPREDFMTRLAVAIEETSERLAREAGEIKMREVKQTKNIP